MVDVNTEITINKTLDMVAYYAADLANAPELYVNIKSRESLHDDSAEPLKVGSKVSFVAHFFGKRLAYIYAFNEFIPSVKLVMRTAQGPLPMETTYHRRRLTKGQQK